MNILKSRNAKAGPKNAYNAYKDFADKETYAHVVACAVEYFQMEDLQSKYFLKLIKLEPGRQNQLSLQKRCKSFFQGETATARLPLRPLKLNCFGITHKEIKLEGL